MKFIFFILCCFIHTSQIYADPITGEGELGFSSFSGNSDILNLNALLSLEQHVDKWKHNFDFEANKSKNNKVIEANNFISDIKSDYFFKQQTYGFGALRYESDDFSSYKFQTSLSSGFGTRIIENDRQDLDLSMGLGVKQSKQQNTNINNTETIIRLGADYLHQITDNSQLIETLLIEYGADNTQTGSNTSFKVFISENIATKITLSIKHNSKVLAGTKNTDTQTSVSLVYGF